MARNAKSSVPLAMTIIEIVAGLWCIGLIVFGAVRAQDALGLACLMTGMLGLIIIAASLPVAWALHGSSFTSKGERRVGSLDSAASSERLLAQIYENSMLSDNAKRVLFRDRELQLLRRAIEDDIAHGDYSSGLTLCDEMADLFGHREEAEAFRMRILQANHAAYEASVHQALDQFEHTLAARDWASAHREAASIRRLYPTHHLVQEIDQRVLGARDEHKKELESRFIDAANRDDVNQAMALLKELDRYLTREEATRLAQIAQDVVVKHRENLSTQFKMAVNDHLWAEAARVGDTIIAEYPNTKMADEVRSMIETLRIRASQAGLASNVNA
jgi:hypothetical protein